MKKSLLILICMATAVASLNAQSLMPDSIAASASALETDTLAVVEGARRVTVAQTPTSSIITIEGSACDPDYFYRRTTEIDNPDAAPTAPDISLSLPFLKERRRSKTEVIWLNEVYIGIGIPNTGLTAIDPSIEGGIGKIVGLRFTPWHRGPKFSIGVGLHVEKYCMHGGMIFDKVRKQLVAIPQPEDADNVRNRIDNAGIVVPITVTQPIYRNFAVAVGAEVKFNTYTTASTKYDFGNTTYEQKFKGLQQRLMTVGLYGAIGWCDEFGLYVRYQPQTLFMKQWGPEFETISAGITIGL